MGNLMILKKYLCSSLHPCDGCPDTNCDQLHNLNLNLILSKLEENFICGPKKVTSKPR